MESSKRKGRFKGWILAILALAFVCFTVWLIHEANIGRDNILFKTVRATPYGDKIGHILLAGSLTLVTNLLIRYRSFSLGRMQIPWGSFIIFVIVAIEEGSQYYLPTRSLDLWDAIANLVGIMVATAAQWGAIQRRR